MAEKKTGGWGVSVDRCIIRCSSCGTTRQIPRDIAEQIGPRSQCKCGATGNIYVVRYANPNAGTKEVGA